MIEDSSSSDASFDSQEEAFSESLSFELTSPESEFVDEDESDEDEDDDDESSDEDDEDVDKEDDEFADVDEVDETLEDLVLDE